MHENLILPDSMKSLLSSFPTRVKGMRPSFILAESFTTYALLWSLLTRPRLSRSPDSEGQRQNYSSSFILHQRHNIKISTQIKSTQNK